MQADTGLDVASAHAPCNMVISAYHSRDGYRYAGKDQQDLRDLPRRFDACVEDQGVERQGEYALEDQRKLEGWLVEVEHWLHSWRVLDVPG